MRDSVPGDPRLDELFSAAYEEWRRLASLVKSDDPRATLSPTTLVNEAFLKLAAAPRFKVFSKLHFRRIVARAMRQVLVDHARRHAAEKRGAGAARVPLDTGLVAIEDAAVDTLALDVALGELAVHDAELARLVELRYFGGLTVEETGRVLGKSPRQVEGAWAAARGFLYRSLGSSAGHDG